MGYLVPEDKALNEDSPVLEAAVFGREVELFLESNVGIYLTQCCAAEIEEATEKLKRIDPHKWEEVYALQAKVWRAESVMGWLADAIRSGTQAKEALTL